MTTTRNNTIKTFLILSLSSMATGFANTFLTTPYRLASRTPTTHRTSPLQMFEGCNINATDIFEKVKRLRGSRSDLIRIGSATSALFVYDTLFSTYSKRPPTVAAEEMPDDSWTVHNGLFTDDEIKDFTKTSSGLLYKDVTTGKGSSPKEGDSVTLQMVGYIYDTGEKWTNTYNGIPAYQSVIRAGPRPNQKFMKGLNEGVLTMKTGGKRILVIPAYLAYNYVAIYSQENPNVTIIPAGAALVCYIELLSFKPPQN
jgi:peptidylprolyl isomerase